MIKEWNNDVFMLGIPFIRTYYMIFDDENSEITLTPRLGSLVTEFSPLSQLPPNVFTRFNNLYFTSFLFFGLIFGAFVAIPLVSYGIYELTRSKSRTKKLQQMRIVEKEGNHIENLSHQTLLILMD
mmetsp:Transcript_23512/g.23177  ORF Transcript_23512/g.23177 Transcript_23512/m.23177 type:complete len:126 (-) Transcript_23512:52-429(-)